MGKIFPANLNRYDPYKTYRFLLFFGQSTTPVAAVSKLTALKRSSNVIEYNEAGNPITAPFDATATATDDTPAPKPRKRPAAPAVDDEPFIPF